MRALFLTSTLLHGGAEHHTITLINRLAERGHECHGAYIKDANSQGDRLRLPPGGSLFCLGARRYLDLDALRRFAAHLQQLRPGVLVAVNAYALLYAWLATRLAGFSIPLVVTFHSTRLVGWKEHLKMLLERWVFPAADCLIYVCAAQQGYWRRRGVFCRRTEVIHNGVDCDRYDATGFVAQGQEIRARYGFAEGDFVIGMVAVLRPEKNHLQLMEAVARLRQRGIPARALLVGDGPMRPAVEALARHLEIEPFVAITGFQTEVRPYIAACDAVALCSTTEALSLAAIEAMAMGRPLAHSEVGGAAELITDGEDGLLFPAGDTPALVRALARLADPREARRMGANARRKAESQFSETAMLDRYEYTLLDLCSPEAAPRAASPHPVPGGNWPVFRNERQTRSE